MQREKCANHYGHTSRRRGAGAAWALGSNR
nr:MAG TPA: hypothetical protein [Caudoviricetes sp.]